MKKIIGIIMVLLMLMSVTVALAGNTKDTQTGGEKVKVIIGYVDKPNHADEDVIRGHGGKTKYTYHIINAKAVEIPKQAIDRIKRNPRVAYVEEDAEVYALDAELDNSWGVKRIGAGVVHDGGNTGAGVKVAIIDTGFDKDHPDLQANVKGGINFVSSPPWRPANPEKWDDDNGHGTHCAGIVAAVDNDGGVIGVAPEAHLYGVKVLDRTGSGYVSDIVAGIEWSVDNGMQVISMSLGLSSDISSLHSACDGADDAGIVVVAAAGNSGPGADTVIYPAKYDSVIAVAATGSSDERASFSSTGPDVELAAPGVIINSTIIGVYGTKSGTSMACPHVAGTAALVIASGISDNDAVRTCLRETAEDLGAPGKDNLYGYGLVNADEAVPPTVPNTPPVANAGSPYSGTEDIAITFDGSGSFDSDGNPLTYAWDFGDGSTGLGVNPTHAYTAGGTYAVTLVVNDGKVDSEPNTTTAGITEVNDPPVADAGSDQTALVNVNVTFNGSGSYDIDSNINTYEWEFGDGTTGTGITATHAYEAAGTYTANLTVTDDEGLNDTDTVMVTVTGEPAYEEPAYPTMHVASIEMSPTRYKANGWYTHAIARVTIVNEAGVPVEGATVEGHWSGLTIDVGSETADAEGHATLDSDSVKNAAGTFTFTVDTVSLTGWIYDPTANVETSDSITV